MLRARKSLAAGIAVILSVLAWDFSAAQAPSAPADPPPAQSQPPASPPANPPPASPPQAEPPPPPAPQAQPAQPADPFGEEIQLAAKKIIFFKGTANWDSAYETLVDSFKTVAGFMEKEGIKAAGPPMTIYITTDDTGFEYRAAVPIVEAPASPPRGDIEVGESPSGKMLKFVHRGSYDAMDNTYEAITNFLDSKQMEARETFIEEYVTDPLTTAEDQLVINVLVPVK